jgi:hypothetical protein
MILLSFGRYHGWWTVSFRVHRQRLVSTLLFTWIVWYDEFFDITKIKVWRYQWCNQNPKFEDGYITQWPKGKTTVCFILWPTPQNWKLGLVKNENLRQKGWFQFSHCELSIYICIYIWSIYILVHTLFQGLWFIPLFPE